MNARYSLSIICCIIVILVVASCSPSGTSNVTIRKTKSNLARVDTLFSQEDSTSARFFVYDPSGLRDPFVSQKRRSRQSSGPGRVPRPSLKVTAIMTGVSNPSAFVNNKLVYEGDVMEGARVVTIQATGVVFEFDGQTFTVRQE